MKTIETFRDFVIEMYKQATPSIDFETAESINPCEHKLNIKTYEDILQAFAGDDNDKRFACNMFTLNKGPQLVY